MPDEKTILEFKRLGPKGFQTFLQRLYKGREFFDAINTDVGKQLFSEASERLDRLHEKLIVNIEVSPEEKVEIEMLRRILNSWSGKIVKYFDDSKKNKDYEELTNG